MAGLADAGALIIALDGKTVRGARTKDGTAPHLLAAMICGARAVIAQRDVDVKTNEITQVKPLLEEVDITGALVTADALHVQKETARYLVEDKGADYLFTAVKDNEPSLFAALDALTGHTSLSPILRMTAGTAGTRPAPCRFFRPPDGLFPHAAQAFLIGTPEVIAAAARGHWDIEALHHVRDTTMNEDAQRLRAGSSAQVIAAVRNTAVAALRLAGFASTAPGRRWAARNPARPIAVLNLA